MVLSSRSGGFRINQLTHLRSYEGETAGLHLCPSARHNVSDMAVFAGSLFGKIERRFVDIVLFFVAFAVLWKGGKSLETTWLLVPLAWLAAFTALRRKPQRDVPLWLWAIGIMFILWTALSYLKSQTSNYGLDEVLRDSSLLLLFFWAARHGPRENKIFFDERLLRTLAYVTIAACVIGLLVYVLQPVNRMVGPFFDFRFHTDYWPNAWAEFLLLGWPAVFFWSQRLKLSWVPQDWQLSLPRTLFLSLPIASLLLTYSRGAIIAFAGQIILFALLRLRVGWRPRLKNTVLREAGLLLLLIVLFFGAANLLRSQLHEVESVADKITFSADEGTSSVSERQQFWVQSLQLAQEKPLFGWGPYSFRFVQPRLQTGVLATSDHPHNVFLKLLMERGVPAALLWIFFIGAIMGWYLVTSSTRTSGKDEVTRDEAQTSSRVAVIAVAGVLAHNSIDYNLQFVGIALPFWLLLGVLASDMRPIAHHVPARLQFGFEALVASVLLLVVIIEGGYLVTSSLGRHAEARGDAETALAWYDRSRNERFSRDMQLSRAQLLLAAGKQPEALAAVDLYLDQNEADGRVWKLLGEVCLAGRDYACALDAYEKAYEINRYNDMSVTLANIELFEKLGITETEARKPEYDALLRAFGEAIEHNRHFIALSPNAEAAISMSQKLAELFPEEEPRYILVGASVQRAAERERAKFAARRPGFLW